MRVASFPRGDEALYLGRSTPETLESMRRGYREASPPLDMTARAANIQPDSTSSQASKKSPHQHSESMAFDMLFDSADGVDDAEMEAIHERDEEYSDSDPDAHDPVSVYVRIVRALSRPKSRVEQAIFTRFRAACEAVGPGEVGDARHIEALRLAFNSYGCDPLGEPVRRRSVSPFEASNANGSFDDASSRDAFVATTPGAVGYAALLNLRHSFLWLEVRETGDSDPLVAPEDSFHPEAFAEARRVAANAAAAREFARSAVPSKGSQSGDGGVSSVSSSETASAVLVLEPDIKAHFVISRPSPSYSRLVDALPKCFVGTHGALVKLVDFMCEQMNSSFRESGMSVPPWRKNNAILSKWFLPAASRSGPTTPSGSLESRGNRRGAPRRDSGRRVSFDVVGGGNVVGVGEAYAGVPYDNAGVVYGYAEPARNVAVGAGA